MKGVWKVSFLKIEELRKKAKIHWYRNRWWREPEKNDKKAELLARFEMRLVENRDTYKIDGPNARCSYIFDASKFEQVV